MTVRSIVTPVAAFALLSMAAAAQAQTQPQSSSVQLYGLVGAYAGSAKLSGAPSSTTVVGGGGMTTSFFGFRGEENLGGGTSAFFTLESFFQPDTGTQGRNATDPLFSRNAYVGLNTQVGKVSFGRHMTPYYINMQVVNPFGGSVVFSPLVVQSYMPTYNNAVLGDSVWNNSVQYTSPNLNGLTTTAIYGAGEVAGHAGVANMGLSARYVRGALTAVGSVQRVRIPGTQLTEQKAWLGGFNYDFRVVKVYAAGEGTQTYGPRAATRTWALGMTVPVSARSSILAGWARTARTAAIVPDNFRNTATVSYDYTLSKHTDVYLAGMYDKRSNAGTGRTTAVGLRHTF
jgi:predicted porin